MIPRKPFLKTFAVTLGLLAATGAVAWTGPSVGAPGGNASAPVNVSNSGQTKIGGLRVNSGGAANGLEVVSGNALVTSGSLGVGAPSPASPVHIAGGTSWTDNGWVRGMIVERAIQLGYGSGVRWGIGNDGNLNIFHTTGDGGVGSGISADYVLSINSTNNRVGVGVYSGPIGSTFTVFGNASVGTTYYATAAPTNGVIVQGAVGIGTPSPLAKLQVNGTSVVTDPGGGQQGIFAISVGAGSAGDAKLEFGVYDTGTAGYSWLQAINASSGFRAIVLNATGGNVGIGTTAPGQKLDVNGAVQATAFYYSSDARLKKNIEAISNNKALRDILALNPVTYNWKDASRGKGTQLGFIAQEVEAIAPELVSTNPETGMKSVDYARAVPLLVGALKAQQVRLDAQQEQLDLLVAEVEELKADK